MTTIHEAIRAAQQWAARLPQLPEPSGEDVAAPLRAAIAQRDPQSITINVIMTEKEYENHTK